jgi:hypothetical protein
VAHLVLQFVVVGVRNAARGATRCEGQQLTSPAPLPFCSFWCWWRFICLLAGAGRLHLQGSVVRCGLNARLTHGGMNEDPSRVYSACLTRMGTPTACTGPRTMLTAMGDRKDPGVKTSGECSMCGRRCIMLSSLNEATGKRSILWMSVWEAYYAAGGKFKGCASFEEFKAAHSTGTR